MQLLPDWKTILTRAWSIRFIVLSALLSAAEVIVPHFADVLPRGVFAALSGFVAAAATLARVLAQPSLRDEPVKQ